MTLRHIESRQTHAIGSSSNSRLPEIDDTNGCRMVSRYQMLRGERTIHYSVGDTPYPESTEGHRWTA